MFLGDVPINYWSVLVAAIVFYILGAIWYSSIFFGSTRVKPLGGFPEASTRLRTYATGLYVTEFIICLIIAYVLALFIQISQAEEIVEGIAVALWAWLGFCVTTHLSAVLWGHRHVRGYIIHMGFLLVGFIVMGAIIISMGF